MQMCSSLSLSLLHLVLDEDLDDEFDENKVGDEDICDMQCRSEDVENAADVNDSNSESESSLETSDFFSNTSWIFSRVVNILSKTLLSDLTKEQLLVFGGG